MASASARLPRSSASLRSSYTIAAPAISRNALLFYRPLFRAAFPPASRPNRAQAVAEPALRLSPTRAFVLASLRRACFRENERTSKRFDRAKIRAEFKLPGDERSENLYPLLLKWDSARGARRRPIRPVTRNSTGHLPKRARDDCADRIYCYLHHGVAITLFRSKYFRPSG